MSHIDPKALTTLDAANAELGYVTGEVPSRDLLISRYINVASDLFATLVGYELHYQETTLKVSQPYGSRRLEIKTVRPVLEVTEIKLKGDVVDPSKYVLERLDLGWIQKNDGTWNSTEVLQHAIRDYVHELVPDYEVTLKAGYVTPQQALDLDLERTLPYDIEDAVLSYVSFRHSRQGSDSTIASQSTGQWSVSYFQGIEIPSTFESSAKRYARMKV